MCWTFCLLLETPKINPLPNICQNTILCGSGCQTACMFHQNNSPTVPYFVHHQQLSDVIAKGALLTWSCSHCLSTLNIYTVYINNTYYDQTTNLWMEMPYSSSPYQVSVLASNASAVLAHSEVTFTSPPKVHQKPVIVKVDHVPGIILGPARPSIDYSNTPYIPTKKLIQMLREDPTAFMSYRKPAATNVQLEAKDLIQMLKTNPVMFMSNKFSGVAYRKKVYHPRRKTRSMKVFSFNLKVTRLELRDGLLEVELRWNKYQLPGQYKVIIDSHGELMLNDTKAVVKLPSQKQHRIYVEYWWRTLNVMTSEEILIGSDNGQESKQMYKQDEKIKEETYEKSKVVLPVVISSSVLCTQILIGLLICVCRKYRYCCLRTEENN